MKSRFKAYRYQILYNTTKDVRIVHRGIKSDSTKSCLITKSAKNRIGFQETYMTIALDLFIVPDHLCVLVIIVQFSDLT